MTTLNDLPQGSGRRFLFGLFGRDHNPDTCEKDGCGDCAIVTHYDQDVGALHLQLSVIKDSLHLQSCGCSSMVQEILAKLPGAVQKCAACRSDVQVDGNSLCDSCREELAGGPL